MSLATFQADLKTLLADLPELAGVHIMLELDEAAATTDLDAQEAEFEQYISTRGLVLVIGSPRCDNISSVRGQPGAGAAHLRLLCQVALVENPRVNRGPVDPEIPDRAPLGRRPLAVLRAIMVAVLGAGYELPASPLTAPEQDLEGLNLHAVLVTDLDDLRAAN